MTHSYIGVDTGKRDQRHITAALEEEKRAFAASGKQATHIPVGVSGNNFMGYKALQKARLNALKGGSNGR